MTDLAQRDQRRDERRRGTRSAPPAGGIQALHLRMAVLPAAAVAVVGAATVTFVLVSGHTGMTPVVLVAAIALMVLALAAAAGGATSATRRVQRQVTALRTASTRAQDDLRALAERAQRGEASAVLPEPEPEPEPAPAGAGDSFALLAGDLQRERHAAQQAVVASAGRDAGAPDQRVEVFVNLARRMQSLVHREIQLLDDLENQVEDPILLKGLFTVDHLATRMRRQSESLAVLGGAVSRRQWSRPVTMHEVLRAAVAEVEQYSRVKVVPPIEGTLLGSAVADVIHLVAELIENATKFSAPHTQALVRAQAVTAGLVIEVEDRGLGMVPADQQRMNDLLADPTQVDVGELLRDGRIGMFVVATLARRHGIRVQLQGNIYGGIQAVVVLPRALIEPVPVTARPARASREASDFGSPQQREPRAVPDVPGPGRAVSGGAVSGGVASGGVAATASAPTVSPVTGPPAAEPPVPVISGTIVTPPVTPEGSLFERPGTSGTGWTTMAAEGRYAPAGRPPWAAAPPPASAPPPPSRPSPPSRPVPPPPAQPAPPAQASRQAQPAGAGAGTPLAAPLGPPHGERPSLPVRHSQTHMAPELRDGQRPRRDGPADDHIPGLMADFRRGISRAAEEDSPPGTDSPR